MAIEIERKFLLNNESWRQGVEGVLFRQGYLCTDPERTVRVRLEGEQGKLTVKGRSIGISRTEFEYDLPKDQAQEMLDTLCLRPLIEKTRYRIEVAGQLWEIDEFLGENSGLVLAEIELSSVDEAFERPDWLGREVSDDPRYFNSNLVKNPLACWITDL